MSSSNGSIRKGSAAIGTKHSGLVLDAGDGVAAMKKIRTDNKCQQNGHALDGRTFKDMLPWSDNDTSVTDGFIGEMVNIFKDFVHETYDRSSRVITFKTPDEVMKEVDLHLPDHSTDLHELVDVTKKILDLSVKTGHPRFYNQLFAGLDITGLMGQWASATANASMYTFEMAPVFGTIERVVLKKMRELVGFKSGDGILFPGGSISNMQAMNLARYKFNPNVKEEGLFGYPRLAVFTSEEGHYSTVKAAFTLGLGTKSVKKVKTDSNGKMITEELRAEIIKAQSHGERPFFVCATSGTTVAGAYDDLEKIGDICNEFGCWFHVDGAWGASALFSKKYRYLVKGIERADSVTWNPHKLISVPIQCSTLLIKDEGLLNACNRADAKYLFQKDKKLYDVSHDTGDKTFQCGRPNDIYKFWLMWKAKGTNGLEEHVDRAFDNSRYLAEQVKKREGFELLIEPECTNTCFRYLPPSVRGMPDGPEKNARLNAIPPEIKKRMTLKGSMMVGYQPLKERVNFFRMIIISAAVTHEDMDFVLDEIERLGKDL